MQYKTHFMRNFKDTPHTGTTLLVERAVIRLPDGHASGEPPRPSVGHSRRSMRIVLAPNIVSGDLSK